MRTSPYRTFWQPLSALIFSLCLALPAAAATDEERAAARSLAKQGAATFEQGQYSETVDLFTRAEALVHSPVHLLFIARANAKLGQLVKAHEAYVKITREKLDASAPKVFVSAQSDAQRELRDIEPRLASLTVTVEGAGDAEFVLTVDGERVSSVLVGVAMPVNPGSHELVVSGERISTERATVTLAEGQRDSLQLTVIAEAGAPPPPRIPGEDAPPVADPSPSESHALTYVGWASIGLGAVGLGVSGYFLYDSGQLTDEADQLQQPCGAACDPLVQAQIKGLDNDSASQRTKAAITGSIGGAFLVTGIVLLIVDGGSDSSGAALPASRQARSTPSLELRPWVGMTSAGFSGSF